MMFKKLLLLAFVLFKCSSSLSPEYLKRRTQIIDTEKKQFMGSEYPLTEVEARVNEYLMKLKDRELDESFDGKRPYPPEDYYYRNVDKIRNSSVFDFLRRMPKGGALHLHDFALTSVDWVIANITHRRNLYVCGFPNTLYPKFVWRKVRPNNTYKCTWFSSIDLRKIFGNEYVDSWYRFQLDLKNKEPDVYYPHIDDVWHNFDRVLFNLALMLSYVPVFRDYLYEGLRQFYSDGVQYMEIRTIMPKGICADLRCSRLLTQIEAAKLYSKVIKTFSADHPQFCGAKLIYAPVRLVKPKVVQDQYLVLMKQLLTSFPNFVVGFDLVGQEDKGRPLIDFADVLMEFKKSFPAVKYFFHAGETNWNGYSTDNNLVDALLLNTTRLGHAYALTKHPEIMKMVIERDIAVEVCPISNQVLGLIKDLRNHPAVQMIRDSKVPLVISSDDPGSWSSEGLTYDFYEAFMALAPKSADLRFLRKLVENSINYSAMNEDEQWVCKKKVGKQWKQFVLQYE